MIKVKIVGSNCKNGNQLYKNMQKAINDIKNRDIELQREDSQNSLLKYNIKNKPALIIDDKLICEGKVLNERELTRILNISYT